MNWWYRYQKIIYIVLFIAFTCLLAWLLYAVFFAAPEPIAVEPISTTGTSSASGLPQAGDGSGQIIDDGGGDNLGANIAPGQDRVNEIARGGPTLAAKLSDAPVLGSTLNSLGTGAQYYNQNDGKFYQVDSSGNISELSDKVFHNVEDVVWAPSKSLAIIEYPDGANIVYDFEQEKQITLPSHWKDFNFSPNSNEIVLKSMGLNPENRWLAISNTDGSRIRAIEPLGTEDRSVYPTWSANEQIVALHTKGVDFNRQEVFFIGQNKENFQSMVVEGRGFDPMWSPQGDKLLYSVYSTDTDMNPNLWISGAQGDNIGTNRKNLNVNTWANKCTYKNDTTVLCAVPKSLDQGSGLFPELSQSTEDELYEINTVTGMKKLVAVPEGAYNMSELSVSENGFHLFFTDKTSNELFKLRLK